MEAALAAEVSLHCVICFEEFSLKDRPPVVLPCGHTYVCMVCSKRLKKCMECREPLYWTPPVNANANKTAAVNAARSPGLSRYSRGRQIQNPPPPVVTPPTQVPFPLPKNLVLLSLIESAECQARLVKEARDKLSYGDETSENSDDEVEESEADQEQNKAITGMTVLAGACGTYAVREEEGLAVLPFNPSKQMNQPTAAPQEEKPLEDEEKKAEEVRDPFSIPCGSTVQVVSVEDGVYKLARGVGYIAASGNQLVKVGGALESSCQLEAMLESVRHREIELQRTLAEAQQLSRGLEEQIELEQQQPEVHPVIAEPRYLEDIMENDENDNSVPHHVPSTPQKAEQAQSHGSPPRSTSIHSSDSTHVEPGDRIEVATPYSQHGNRTFINSPAHSCPALTADMTHPFLEGRSAGLPAYRVNNEDEFHGLTLGFGCGSSLFGERLIETAQHDRDELMALSFDDSLVEDNQTISGFSRDAQTVRTMPLQPSNNAFVSDSLALPESPVRSGSFDGVNWRTGMSCHRGLGQTKKKSSPSASRRNIRMMSEHRGIGRVRNHLHPGGVPGIGGATQGGIGRRPSEHTQPIMGGQRILSPPDKSGLR